MILGQQQANKVLPLITNLEAYEAFMELLNILHAQKYNELVHEDDYKAQGALILIDELKQLKERLRDSGRSITK